MLDFVDSLVMFLNKHNLGRLLDLDQMLCHTLYCNTPPSLTYNFFLMCSHCFTMASLALFIPFSSRPVVDGHVFSTVSNWYFAMNLEISFPCVFDVMGPDFTCMTTCTGRSFCRCGKCDIPWWAHVREGYLALTWNFLSLKLCCKRILITKLGFFFSFADTEAG